MNIVETRFCAPKVVLIIFLTVMTVGAANPAVQYTEDPVLTAKRVVDGNTYYVNKQPKQWHLIVGKYIRPHTYTSGWVVTGKIDGATNNTTFILKNSPADALSRFTRLKARYQVLKPQLADIQKQYIEATNNLAATSLNIDRLNANPSQKPGSKEDRDWAKKLDDAQNQQKLYTDQRVNLGDQLDALKTEMDQLKASGMNFEGEFFFSAYAIRTAQVVDNLPVYDRGTILQ